MGEEGTGLAAFLVATGVLAHEVLASRVGPVHESVAAMFPPLRCCPPLAMHHPAAGEGEGWSDSRHVPVDVRLTGEDLGANSAEERLVGGRVDGAAVETGNDALVSVRATASNE